MAVVLMTIAADGLGGVVVNATGSNKRWLHGPGRTNRFDMLYVAAHVHPFVVALVVPGFSWTAAVVVYASVLSAALAIYGLPALAAQARRLLVPRCASRSWRAW